MSQALTNIQQELQKRLQNIDKSVAPPSANVISTKGKLFTLPTGQSSAGPIDVIILDWVHANSFYEGAYNANEPKPPVCWSINSIIEDMAPSENCPKPQNSSCHGCPKNEFKSAANGKGKACKNTVRLALIPADGGADSEAMTLAVSPTGIKNYSNYVLNLRNELGVLPIQVVTQVSFNPNETFPTLMFGNPQPHDKLEEIYPLIERVRPMLSREPDAA